MAHKRLNVYEDQVELPNGKYSDYIHFGAVRDAACVIAINQNGKILVQKEYSYPPNEWLYQFPGGGLESSESPTDGAARELAEEAGLGGELAPIGWFYSDNRRRKDKCHIFTCQNLVARSEIMDEEEAFETFWFTASEIDELIAKGKIVNYSMLAAWAVYKVWSKD